MWALEEQSQGRRRSCLSSLPEKSEELKKNSKHVRRNGAGLRRVTLPKKRAKKTFRKSRSLHNTIGLPAERTDG